MDSISFVTRFLLDFSPDCLISCCCNNLSFRRHLCQTFSLLSYFVFSSLIEGGLLSVLSAALTHIPCLSGIVTHNLPFVAA